MSENNDWRPVVFMLGSMFLFGPAIRLWFDMATEKSRLGKWAFGILAAVNTAFAAASLAFFFLFASGVLK